MAMSELQAAYLAGLFEGEGCIEKRYLHSVCINIGSTDLDVITKVHEMTGVGHLRKAQTLPSGRNFYVWRVSKAADAAEIINAMLPYLGERRTCRAKEMLERLAAKPVPRRLSSVCKNGHDLTGDNLSSFAHHKVCKICNKESTRRFRARQNVQSTAQPSA
jgi:hypothetical protein